MKIYIISAKAKNNVIGMGNDLPWNLPEDLKFFKNTTSGHAILMGLNTWYSLPFKPLKGRKNFILCPEGTEIPEHPDVELVHDIDKFIQRTDIEDVFIMGGATVYRLFIDKADELYLTLIDKEVEGDVYFPDFDEKLFTRHVLGSGYDEKEGLIYTFNRFVRKNDRYSRFDRSYLKMAEIWGMNSHADNHKVGALIVKNNQIISDGYNGMPWGFDNRCEHEELHKDNEGNNYIDTITNKEVLHAEANAITKVAKSNYSSEGATLYVTLSPCFDCAKLIIQAGIKRVVYKEKYKKEEGLLLLEQAGIETLQINDDN